MHRMCGIQKVQEQISVDCLKTSLLAGFFMPMDGRYRENAGAIFRVAMDGRYREILISIHEIINALANEMEDILKLNDANYS